MSRMLEREVWVALAADAAPARVTLAAHPPEGNKSEENGGDVCCGSVGGWEGSGLVSREVFGAGVVAVSCHVAWLVSDRRRDLVFADAHMTGGGLLVVSGVVGGWWFGRRLGIVLYAIAFSYRGTDRRRVSRRPVWR